MLDCSTPIKEETRGPPLTGRRWTLDLADIALTQARLTGAPNEFRVHRAKEVKDVQPRVTGGSRVVAGANHTAVDRPYRETWIYSQSTADCPDKLGLSF